MYYCEPSWHNADLVDAEYLILPPLTNEGGIGFSCCGMPEHLKEAIDTVIKRGGPDVRVRKVSNARPER